MNPTLFAALLLLVPFFLLLAKKSRNSAMQKMHVLPSPPSLPFIGNFHQLGSLPHRSLFDLSKKHGPLMLLHLGSIPTVVVSSADFAREFMRTHDAVFSNRPSLKVSRVLTYNNIDIAFAPYGECWRQMRRIATTHLFNSKMVRSFSSLHMEEAAHLLERVSDHNGVVLCVSEMLDELVNNVLCRVILGTSMNDKRRRLICSMVQQNSRFFSKVFVEDLFPKLGWLDRILGLENKLRNHFEIWEEEFIEDHLINKSKDQCDSTYFIDVLLQLQKDSSMEFVITKKHIKAALMDMFTAGTDTSFTTLDWSMVELIQNPKVMKKAQDEVRAVADGDDMINEDHLDKIFYLKAVIKEVLRLHPPAPLLLPRESSQDCVVQGYHIPKKTRVVINSWAIARDGANWEDPEEFKPERFLGGSATDCKDKEFHYIPFGAGRRICPGISFSNTFLALVLANLLHRFDWKLPDGVSVEDMNMEESPGLTSLRKEKLELIPMLFKKTN